MPEKDKIPMAAAAPEVGRKIMCWRNFKYMKTETKMELTLAVKQSKKIFFSLSSEGLQLLRVDTQ